MTDELLTSLQDEITTASTLVESYKTTIDRLENELTASDAKILELTRKYNSSKSKSKRNAHDKLFYDIIKDAKYIYYDDWNTITSKRDEGKYTFSSHDATYSFNHILVHISVLFDRETCVITSNIIDSGKFPVELIERIKTFKLHVKTTNLVHEDYVNTRTYEQPYFDVTCNLGDSIKASHIRLDIYRTNVTICTGDNVLYSAESTWNTKRVLITLRNIYDVHKN